MTAPLVARQGAAFLVIGLAATAVHITVALCARQFLHASPLAANFMGYACAVGVSYIGNARWTFRAAHRNAQLGRFIVVSLAGLALNQALTFLLAGALRLPFVIALAAVVVAVPVFTFLLSRAWVFRSA